MEITAVVSPFIRSNILANIETNELDLFVEEFICSMEEENPKIRQMVRKIFLDSLSLEKQARMQAVS